MDKAAASSDDSTDDLDADGKPAPSRPVGSEMLGRA
jgi:hypothetical protein